MSREHVEVLERGDIYVFYSAAADEDVESIGDIEDLYLVMHADRGQYRFVVVGQNVLPTIEQKGATRRNWAYVDFVTDDARDVRRRLSERGDETPEGDEQQLAAARPVAEGRYNLATHGDHAHLAYVLELPEEPGLAQRELRLPKEASYLISIKNPERSEPAPGLERQAEFPAELQRLFEGNKWAPVTDTRLLDFPGAEVLLIGASEDVEAELGITMRTEDEDRETADIFQDLELNPSSRPLEPLFRGEWR